jgi:DNA-directed RNA polymerase subunit M/transcription elongation factor TFIIS
MKLIKQWFIYQLRIRFNLISCYKCGSIKTKVIYETQHPFCKEGIMMKMYECKKCGHIDGI